MCGIDVKFDKLSYNLEVRTLIGDQNLVPNMMYKNCEILIGDRKLLVDLVTLLIRGYDVIVGMNYLSRYQSQLNCRTKIVDWGDNP